MVERYRPGAKAGGRVGAKGPNPTSFKKDDGRARNGRKKGVPNRIPGALKDVILLAMEKLGDDNKGRNGALGWFMKLFRRYPELSIRLTEKILPMQIVGPGGGPVQVMNIPPELLKDMSVEQLQVLEQVLAHLGGTKPVKVIEHIPGNAEEYAKDIGITQH